MVTVNTTPGAPFISAAGATAICASDSLWIRPSGPGRYLWSTGVIADSIYVRATGNYTARAILGTCTSAVSNAIAVTATVVAPPRITYNGSTTICAGTTANLNSSRAAGGATYLWSTGATTRAIAVTTSGTYTVQFIRNGCTSVASAPIVINVTNPPAAPVISSTGALTFCAGDSVKLSSSITSDSLLWSNGATTTDIWAKVSGTYTALIKNGGCNSVASNSITVTANAAPATPTITTTGGRNSFCTGDSTTLTSSVITGGSYLWSTGATTRAIRVRTAGTYTVQTIRATCSSAVSAPKVITESPVPATPSITFNGTALDAGITGTSFIWTLNGNLLTAQTAQTLNGPAAGTYTVKVISGGCTSAVSAPFIVTATAALMAPGKLSVYPNPASGEVRIEGLSGFSTVRLYNSLGQLMLEQNADSQTTLNISSLPAGMYQVVAAGRTVSLVKE